MTIPRNDNPADKKDQLLVGGSSFRPSNYLYRTLQPGQDFLYQNGFATYAEALERIRSTGKPVVLSIGESVVSGWDTTVTPGNRERKAQGLEPVSAFFRYRNYTDMLREKIGSRYEVLNYGMPGHTIVSGLRRFRFMQKKLAADGVTLKYVVIHYGPNDCLWEGNFRDPLHLVLHPRSPAWLEQLRRRVHRRSNDGIVPRLSLGEWDRYHRALLRAVRRAGAAPILVESMIPIYWRPGSRFVDYDFDQLARQPGGQAALASLERSRTLWAEALELPYSEKKVAMLYAAAELDFLLPRAKRAYVSRLRDIAAATATPLVRMDVPRDEDEKLYFIDYVHTQENVNEQLADRIVAAMASRESFSR